MVTFDNDEAEYLQWIAAHPRGFVLNSERNPKADSTRLHRATCWSIGPEAHTNYTTNEYIKLCSERRDEVETWAKSRLGVPPTECPRCKPN